jgi:peptide/nickel transport system permease protein
MNVAEKRFKIRNRSAVVGGSIVAFFFFVAVFADFLAPYDYRDQVRLQPSAPPSSIRLIDTEGSIRWPFVYERKLSDPRNFTYEEDAAQPRPIILFAQGREYSLLGILTTDRHLLGVESPDGNTRLNLLGTDQLGRDRFSRLIYAIRFSLIVSPLGTLLACLIGVIFGAVSGYARSSIDSVMMGVADTVISLPSLILILAARTAFPLELPPLTAAAMMITIFALTGWAEMARLTRGLVWSVKNREYVLAARSLGLSESRILLRHVVPNIAPAILVQATLMLPLFLLSEVALSFLGVGLQEPEPSLGNMLGAAVDLVQLRNAPLIVLSPAFVILLFVVGVRLIRSKNVVSI